jgi:hypothetical protein
MKKTYSPPIIHIIDTEPVVLQAVSRSVSSDGRYIYTDQREDEGDATTDAAARSLDSWEW